MRKPVDAKQLRAANYAREEEVRALRSEPGDRGKINRMAWGSSDAEFELMAQAEFAKERDENPHAFVAKFSPRGRKAKGKK